MTYLKSPLWVTVAVVVLALAVWFAIEGSHAAVQTQETYKVLEIERYPNEPLELVKLNIGTQSVKNRVKPKFNDSKSKWGIDSVKFNEKDDWYKHVSITLRNTSDKPVYGLHAYLFFKPDGFPISFSMPLTSKELWNDPLAPGDEIELSVNQGSLNQTLADVKNRGTDVSNAVVSFSLDRVIFSRELHWYRGKLLHPDPTTPGLWIPVDQPLAMKRNGPLAEAVSFKPTSFKPAARLRPGAPVFATCVGDGGLIGTSCSGQNPDCITRNDFPSGFGVLSHQLISGPCEWIGHGPSSCTSATTIHNRLEPDAGCICPEQWEDEAPTYLPGGGYDCTLCSDGVDNDCDGPRDGADWGCNLCPSPVLVDVSGNGFNLTNNANGVNFDLNNDGTKEKLSWTAPQSDDAWLALDRNGDGAITNGAELFGNYTPQPNPPVGYGNNGFNALSEYDQPAKGGNDDGLITDRDTIFGNLRLWQDKNHNGVSEADEIRTLSQLGLKAIECYYGESRRRDQHGNLFRYRAKVSDLRGTKVGRWAYDVFLVSERAAVAQHMMRLLGTPAKSKLSIEW